MKIKEAVDLIDQAQRDNLTETGDLKELKTLLDDGDTEMEFITELVEMVNMPRAQIQSVVNEAIGRLKKWHNTQISGLDMTLLWLG